MINIQRGCLEEKKGRGIEFKFPVYFFEADIHLKYLDGVCDHGLFSQQQIQK